MVKTGLHYSAWLTSKKEQSIREHKEDTSFLQAKAIANRFGLTARQVSVSFKVFIIQPQPNLLVGNFWSSRKLSPFGGKLTLSNFRGLFRKLPLEDLASLPYL